MSARQRNEYLDLSSGDENNNSGYDSSAAEEANFSRTAKITSHRSKRQKLHVDVESTPASSDDAESNTDRISDQEIIQTTARNSQPPPPSAEQDPTSPQTQASTPSPNENAKPSAKTKPKPLTASSIAATNLTAQKAGVVYLSRIPPFMRPSTVRSLLSAYGPITRLFLTPEPPTSYLARRARGGNRKKSFIDGWVEFGRKRHARVCADAINARTIGGRGGRFYGDDVWNARYLRGFAWGDLMADVRGEEREREERVRVGVGREVRERKAFLRQVEKSKIEETRRRKAEARVHNTTATPTAHHPENPHLLPPPPQPPIAKLPTSHNPTTNQHQQQHRNPPFKMRFRQTKHISSGGGVVDNTSKRTGGEGGVGEGGGGNGGVGARRRGDQRGDEAVVRRVLGKIF